MIVARQIIQMVRQISSVMKKEASVIRDMSSFPEVQDNGGVSEQRNNA
jgi:hypothetical protein